MAFYTYILASKPNGTLYCGPTDSIACRIPKHQEKRYSGFTAKYEVFSLVWYEVHDTREGAFRRERQIKKWYRRWKIAMIQELNPAWTDLYQSWND